LPERKQGYVCNCVGLSLQKFAENASEVNPHHARGVAELLTFLTLIAGGFQFPLKSEHSDIFMSSVLPLFQQCEHMALYRNQLLLCADEFISNDAALAAAAAAFIVHNT
jgi:hypothetical protein